MIINIIYRQTRYDPTRLMRHLSSSEIKSGPDSQVTALNPKLFSLPELDTIAQNPLTAFLMEMSECWMYLQYPEREELQARACINRLHRGFLSKCSVTAFGYFETLMGIAFKIAPRSGASSSFDRSYISSCDKGDIDRTAELLMCISYFEQAYYHQGRLLLKRLFYGQYSDAIEHYILLLLAELNRPTARI